MTESAENDAWSYAPHEGPHEFRPWCVYPPDWWAPGCTCGVIRSAGPRTETEEAHARVVGEARRGPRRPRDDHAHSARRGHPMTWLLPIIAAPVIAWLTSRPRPWEVS